MTIQYIEDFVNIWFDVIFAIVESPALFTMVIMLLFVCVITLSVQLFKLFR